MGLDRVNAFLTTQVEETPKENTIALNGPDAMQNILVNETLKLNKLEHVSNELLAYLTDSKEMKKLSYKEKQNLLQTINNIQTDSRDFIFRVAELATKNVFIQQVLKATQEPKQIITSSNGETYVSQIDDETRRNLSELLRDVVNDRVRNS